MVLTWMNLVCQRLRAFLEAKMADNRKSLIATGGITSAQEIFKSLILGS